MVGRNQLSHSVSDKIPLAVLHATVSASFIIEQGGLPSLSDCYWNGELPQDRLENLRNRVL